MNKSVVNTTNTGAGGDSYEKGLKNLIAEFDVMYGIVNGLFRLNAGATAPVGAQQHDLWVDTNSDPPILKRLAADLATWENLGASGLFNSGLGMDAAFAAYSSRCLPAIQPGGGGDTIYVPASSGAPATVWINGLMLQNTGNETVAVSTDGLWKVYARRSGATSSFTIGVTAGEISALGFDAVQIGEALFGAQATGGASTLLYCVPLELYPDLDYQPLGFFHLARDGAQNFQSGVEDAVVFNEVVPSAADGDSWKASDRSATVGAFVCRRAGKYELNASVRFDHSAPTTHRVLARLVKGRSTPIELARNLVQLTAEASVVAKVSCYAVLAVGDIIDLKVTQTNGVPATLSAWSANHSDSDTALWGRYLGAA